MQVHVVHLLICILKGSFPLNLIHFYSDIRISKLSLYDYIDLIDYHCIILMMFIFVPNNEHHNINF